MATMNISLPEKLKRWVDSKSAAGGYYANASDYVRDLIRRDMERAADIARLQKEIEIGLASGVSDTSIEELSAEARRRGRAAAKARDAA